MVLAFTVTLDTSLKEIDPHTYREFIIHSKTEKKTFHNACEIVERHGQVKWQGIELLNEHYGTTFCLSHWLHEQGYTGDDDVSSFLNEAGSNVLSHSEFKAPWKFHLWLGKQGFIIGIQQKGRGFNAREIDEKRIKQNEGAAFEFFRRCRSMVFFDDSKNARIVYFKFTWP